MTTENPPDGGRATALRNLQRLSDGDVDDGAVPRIAWCPDPDCSAPAEIYAEVALESTDGPVRHARTFCLNRHFYQLPVEYIPGMPPRTR